jgi:hypothetical protein
MKVFLSWSGERSQALAEAVKDWLQLVLHYVEPWLSQLDIEAGERWATEVAKELEASNFGIITITRENISSPWILFEAGALARSIQEGRVVPLLLDIEFKDVTGPLAQFQSKKVDMSGLTDVVRALNSLSKVPIPDGRLNQLVELAWPKFEEKLVAIPKTPPAAKHNRPQSEILEELVSGIRGLDSRLRDGQFDEQKPRRRRRFSPTIVEDIAHTIGGGPEEPLKILLVCSLLREDAPWLYELAAESYRLSSTGPPAKAYEANERLLEAFRMTRRGPMRELFHDKENYAVLRETEHYLEYLLSRLNDRLSLKPSRPRGLRAGKSINTPAETVAGKGET